MLSPQTLIHETGTTPQLQSIEGVPTRTDVAFTNKDGVEKKGIRNETEKLLKQLSPALRRVLQADEFVVYLAGACAPMNGIEQYTFGYFAQFVSRVVLVFTNQRLLAFRVKHNGEWRKSLRGCSLGDLRSAKMSGWIVGYLKLQYGTGKKESYWNVKSCDKAKLRVLLPKLLQAGGAQAHGQAMQPMCPTCAAALIERHYECAGCGQKFFSEDSLWWRSFIPGGAYFYARQTSMGVVHAIGDSIVTLYLLLAFIGAFAVNPAGRQEVWIGMAVIALILLFERSIALFHARRFIREFIPIDGSVRVAIATAGRA
jgi:hypothetical protein